MSENLSTLESEVFVKRAKFEDEYSYSSDYDDYSALKNSILERDFASESERSIDYGSDCSDSEDSKSDISDFTEEVIGIVRGQKMYRIPVNAYDIDGNFVKNFESITSASRWLQQQEGSEDVKYTHAHVSNSANRGHMTAKKYRFKKTNTNTNPNHIDDTPRREW